MKKFLLAVLITLAPATGGSQAQASSPPSMPAATAPAAATLPDADPALWVVRDEDTTIYLFGTFHLLDRRPWFNDEIRIAFDQSDELVVEAIVPDDPAELQPMIVRYAIDQEGRRLSQRLSAEQNAALTRALASIGATAAAFDALEPWFASMTIAALGAQKLGISQQNGPEGVLIREARARDMPVSELEGIEWQIRLFDGMPEEQQLGQLRDALDNFDGIAESLAPMLAAWSSGDVEGLRRIIEQQGETDPDLHRLLFTNRNATWAGWIEERMSRPGIVFLAVGAGHLAGGDSVQAALRARGFDAERVPHVEEMQ